MSALGFDAKDAPKTWRAPMQLLGFIAVVATGVLATVAFIDNRAAAQAEITTRQVLAKDIEVFKVEAREAARSAAREGAEQAVRDVVGPLSAQISELDKRETGHEREDAAKQQATDDAIKELKQRIR